MTETKEALPIWTAKELAQAAASRKREGKERPRALLTPDSMAEILHSWGKFKANGRDLLRLSSRQVGLVSAPIRQKDQALFLYPDHFERFIFVLTLREFYELRLPLMRELLKVFPKEHEHLILDRTLSREEIIDLWQHLSRGSKVEDVLNIKATELMLRDMATAYEKVHAHAKGELQELEERLILERLDQLKAWVTRGGRREFLQLESEQDAKFKAPPHRIFDHRGAASRKHYPGE